jgi:hypothetical protein
MITYKYLFQDGSDIKKYNGTSWSVIGTVPVTQAMFDSDGMRDLSVITDAAIKVLTSNQPKLLVSTNAGTVAGTITAVPNGRVILPSGDIDVPVQGFTSLQITAILSGAGDLKILASVDGGTTYKAWNGAAWATVATDAAAAKAGGMTPTVLNAITAAQWMQLIGTSSKIRFAYYLEQALSTDTAAADLITIQPKDIATGTPLLQSAGVTFDEVTLTGRLQDLEQINAINMAKLNFKSNALLMSAKYSLYEMVVDTFDTNGGVDASATTASYDTINKRYNGAGNVVMAVETVQASRKKLIVVPDGSTDVTLQYSLDGGTTWQSITANTVTDISAVAGASLKVKAALPAAGSTLTGIAFSWA